MDLETLKMDFHHTVCFALHSLCKSTLFSVASCPNNGRFANIAGVFFLAGASPAAGPPGEVIDTLPLEAVHGESSRKRDQGCKCVFAQSVLANMPAASAGPWKLIAGDASLGLWLF